MSELSWLWAAILAYGAGAVAASTGSLRAPVQGWHARLIMLLLTSAVALVATAVAVRWQRVGHGPFLTLFEVLLSNLFSLGLLFGLAYWLFPVLRPGARFTLPVLLALALWAAGTSTRSPPLPATYDNPWLWVHVIAGKLFLGALLVAAGTAAAVLSRAGRPAHAGVAPAMNTALWNVMSMAFVFDTLMLVAGAAWARDAWGRFWSWDPLETWSFVVWLVLAMLLHLKVRQGLPAGLGAVSVILLFLLALVTFLGIPFLSVAAHKGVV